jgi:hypothetical protein
VVQGFIAGHGSGSWNCQCGHQIRK